MNRERVYICPHCQAPVTVAVSYSKTTLVCGTCWEEFEEASQKLSDTSIEESCGDWDELTAEQKTIAALEGEYVMDIGMWAELYPWLTRKLIKEATRFLDESQPSWRTAEDNCDRLVISTIQHLHPELLRRRKRLKRVYTFIFKRPSQAAAPAREGPRIVDRAAYPEESA